MSPESRTMPPNLGFSQWSTKEDSVVRWSTTCNFQQSLLFRSEIGPATIISGKPDGICKVRDEPLPTEAQSPIAEDWQWNEDPNNDNGASPTPATLSAPVPTSDS